MATLHRADHVGSFLRPPELLEARRAGVDPERLRAIEDGQIRRVLAKQQELGFDVFTDGELRRRNFMSDFTDAVAGFDLGDAVDRTWRSGDPGVAVSTVTGIVNAKLRSLRRLTGHELPFLREHCPGAIKITLPSATQFPAIAYKRGITDAVYPSPSDLLWDIVSIMKQETAALAGDAVPYIQIDAPRYSYYVDPKWRQFVQTEMKMDPDTAAGRGDPRGQRVLCGGPAPGRHAGDPPVPREQPQPLVCGGWVRSNRGEAVRHAAGRPVPPRVRR